MRSSEKMTEAKLEIEKDHARLAKALDAPMRAGNVVAWAKEVREALAWVETDTRAYLALVRREARKRAAEAILPGVE